MEGLARRPSAGFAQGVSLLVLETPEERERFWSATAPVLPPVPTPGPPAGTARPNRWLDGMRTAPVLVLVQTSREAYLDRIERTMDRICDRMDTDARIGSALAKRHRQ